MVTVSPPSVGHGGTISVSLSGDCFTDTFSIVVKARTLGTIATDATGSGSGSFALPCAVNVGTHTVTAADAFGNSGSASLGVTPAPCASAPGHKKGHRPPDDGGGPPNKAGHHGQKSRSDVRIAGVNAEAGIPVGAAVVGAAGLVLLSYRKRRKNHQLSKTVLKKRTVWAL
jgi:hypothetical protein